MLTRLQSNWKFHTLLMGIQNGKVTLEKSLGVSYKGIPTLKQ